MLSVDILSQTSSYQTHKLKLELEIINGWLNKMGTSDLKNEMDWLGKVWRTDPKKCEGPVRKMKKIELDWFEKWERLTGKDGKVWLKKMGKCDSKNEKYWRGKVGRTDPKKWEGLTQKMKRTDLEKWEGLSRTNGKTWLKKWDELTWKSGKD